MIFATPDEAEAYYYEAFANADADMMAGVWLPEDHAGCIHPLAERIRGFRPVVASWRAIFESQGPVPIEFTSVEKHLGPALAVHVGLEVVRQDAHTASLVVTNIYQLTRDGWRMLLHHASPQPAVAARNGDSVH